MKKPTIILILLTLIGLFYRLYFINFQSYWMDESFSINAISLILQKGLPILANNQLYFNGIFYHYLSIPFYLLFNELGLRILSAILGTLIIPITYLLSKKLFNSKVALLSSFFVTFLTILIAWSRQARFYPLFVFFFLLSLYFFVLYLQKPTEKNFKILIASTLLTILSNTLGFILVLVYLFYYKKFKLSLIKRNWYLFLIFFLVLIYSIINYNFIFVNYSKEYLSYLFKAHFSFMYLALMGLIISKKKTLILTIFIAFIVLSFFIPLFHFRYLLFLIPLFIILASFLIIKISFNLPKSLRYIVLVILIGLVLINSFTLIPSKTYNLERFTPMPDFSSAYSFVKDNYSNEVIIDAYPTLNKIYLDKIDYSLDFTLSNLTSEVYDYNIYTGIKFISLDSLKELDNCYIILDEFAFRGLDNDFKEYLDTLKIVYEKFTNEFSYVRVYSC